MQISSLKELFAALKTRFYTFLSDVAFNFSTLEGMLLAIAVQLFPEHSKEICEFAATWLGLKSKGKS